MGGEGNGMEGVMYMEEEEFDKGRGMGDNGVIR